MGAWCSAERVLGCWWGWPWLAGLALAHVLQSLSDAASLSLALWVSSAQAVTFHPPTPRQHTAALQSSGTQPCPLYICFLLHLCMHMHAPKPKHHSVQTRQPNHTHELECYSKIHEHKLVLYIIWPLAYDSYPPPLFKKNASNQSSSYTWFAWYYLKLRMIQSMTPKVSLFFSFLFPSQPQKLMVLHYTSLENATM